MLDPRKYCPQCGGDQLKPQVPKTVSAGFVAMMGSVFIAFGLLGLTLILKPARAGFILDLADLFIVLVIPGTGLIFIMALMRSRLKAYGLKCRQCGYQWAVTKEEWLQAGDEPVRTKDLSSQERQQRREVVQSLIDYFNKK